MTVRVLAGLLALALLLNACAIPHRKDTNVPTKPSVDEAEARHVVAAFNAVRKEADELLDGSLLADVEGGSLLEIDQGAYFVAARVDEQSGFTPLRLGAPERVLAPRFARYPMWFVAVCGDRAKRTRRVAVFRREDSVSPWLMTMAPEIAAGTTLPQLAVDPTGAVVTVAQGDDSGVSFSPAAGLRGYAAALTNWGPAARELFVPGDFVRETRAFQRAQKSLPNAEFDQTWAAESSEFALRTTGGGVLVFGTLSRLDTYRVDDNSYIDWRDNADAKAYLPGRVTTSARLEYRHQVLLFIPPEGGGRAQLVGQYGGVVDGSGS